MELLEKVVKGLEHCEFGGSGTCYENDCPYYQSHDCTDELKNDILSLLKEQEARVMTLEEQEPKPVELYGKDEWYGLVCICPDCGTEWMSGKEDTHFCPKCGRAVKWE